MNDLRMESLKTLARRTAESFDRPEGRLAFDLIRRLDLLETLSSNGANGAVEPGDVGVWRAKDGPDGRFFERRADRAVEWPLWADLPRIEPKNGKKRVVLLGESVARGWFYEPAHTPARVLEEMLSQAGIRGSVEVVDLARTDLDLDGIDGLLGPVQELEPDLVVTLGGNNWVRSARAPLLATLAGRQRAAEALREDGVAGLRRVLEEATGELVDRHLEHLQEAIEARHVPFVYLIPEWNLGDWRDEHQGLAPWLPEPGANADWEDHRQAAFAALERDDLDAIVDAADRMGELDGGLSAVAPWLLAEVARRRGDTARAIELFEKARDARIWDGTFPSPRPLSLMQERLRRLSENERLAVVDLPAVFRRHLGGEAPDRRLFTDYCHLTAEGIRVAMAATAAAAAPFLGGSIDDDLLAEDRYLPSPELEAQARFGAAIHTAHWGQTEEVVLHHCRRALAASPTMERAMQLYIDLQTRQAPVWMCESTERLAQLPDVSLQRYIMKTHLKLFDRTLLGAMATALEEYGGEDAIAGLDRLRRQEIGFARGRSLDLLTAYFAESWDDRERNWASKTGTPRHFRAHRKTSTFPLVVDDASVPAVLEITCRVPGSTTGESLLEIDGRTLAEFELGTTWRSWRIALPADAVRPGVGELTVRWASRPADPAAALERAAEELERGRFPDNLLPVFGEIYALRLVAAA